MGPIISPEALYTGPPHQLTIKWILANTYTDQQGRRYYTKSDGSIATLRSPESFRELNYLLSCHLDYLRNLLAQARRNDIYG